MDLALIFIYFLFLCNVNAISANQILCFYFKKCPKKSLTPNVTYYYTLHNVTYKYKEQL